MAANKEIFEAEKITFLDFKMLKGQIDAPEDFDVNKVMGHHLENKLHLGYNMEEKLAKADFTVDIVTRSEGDNIVEATGNFHLIYIYQIENLDELVRPAQKDMLEIHPGLSNALASVTYSTTRGILLTRLQGTALQTFVLPIINPIKLLVAQE